MLLLPPRFWKHYADDTFTSLPKTLITPFMDHLNGIEPSIKFTVEEEMDGQPAFLDESIISTSVYRKATHTNLYLSFRSHHPTAHKVAVVRTVMTRAENLSSLGVEWTEEEKRVTDALRVERARTTLTPPYIRGLLEAIKCVLPPWGSR